MNTLAIQKAIREEGLEAIVEKWSLKINETEDLIQLNYNQLDSPRGVPEVNECRGLVLEKGTWDVVAYPFKRFYNLGEIAFADKVKYNTSVLFEKVDGSIIILYSWKGLWKFSTRGRINADGNINLSNKTFSQLIGETAQQYNLSDDVLFKVVGEHTCLMMELCTKENRVVTPYEKPMLRLLSARELRTGCELDLNEVQKISEAIEVPMPKIFGFTGLSCIKDMILELPTLEEGYVVCDYSERVDGSWKRIKIKNPAYLAIAHVVGNGITEHGLLDIARGEFEEFVGYFPEFLDTIKSLRGRFDKLVSDAEILYTEIEPLAYESRKDFALAATKFLVPSCLFSLLDGHVDTAKDYFREMDSKRLLQYLKKDE